MNIFHERSDALTGLACPKKAFYTPHPDKQSTQDEYVAPVRTYYHVGDQQSVQASNYGNAKAGESGTAMVEDRGTAHAGTFDTATAGEWGQWYAMKRPRSRHGQR